MHLFDLVSALHPPKLLDKAIPAQRSLQVVSLQPFTTFYSGRAS